MSKTIQTLALISGIGLVVWLVSRSSAKAQTVVVPQPVATSTGTMSTVDQFFNAFRRVPTTSLGSNGQKTADIIKASAGVLKELPGVFKGIGEAWSSWKTPTTTTPTKTASVDTGFDSSYEDYYGGSWN